MVVVAAAACKGRLRDGHYRRPDGTAVF